MQTAQFDRLKKASMNTLDEGDVLSELGRAFPKDPLTSKAFPEGWTGVASLVLNSILKILSFKIIWAI